MAGLPVDNKLLDSEPSSKGTNPFDNKGIMPRSTPAPIGNGTNETSPYEGKGWSSASPKKAFNERM